MNPRRILGILFIFAAVIAFTVPVAYSQMGAARGQGRRLYNPATETTVRKGQSTKSRPFPARGAGKGLISISKPSLEPLMSILVRQPF
jgi:hypothetical protein